MCFDLFSMFSGCLSLISSRERVFNNTGDRLLFYGLLFLENHHAFSRWSHGPVHVTSSPCDYCMEECLDKIRMCALITADSVRVHIQPLCEPVGIGNDMVKFHIMQLFFHT